MDDNERADLAVELYEKNRHVFDIFLRGVVDKFRLEPRLNSGTCPVIHSLKYRLKHPDHLRDKIRRKWKPGVELDESSLFRYFTDFAGARVLHLFQDRFSEIHRFIVDQVNVGDWVYAEDPLALSWDPEARGYFEAQGLKVEIRPTLYTSIHYVIRPRPESLVSCEIQVRTLFEEVWGEIDHAINYPEPTKEIASLEQLRVLAKLVGTGTRLADAIYRTSPVLNARNATD